MVISNLGQADDPAAVAQLDLKKLGLDRREIEAEDALTREKLTLEKGKLTLPLNKLRMRMVLVR
jgi:hypothetical protein